MDIDTQTKTLPIATRVAFITKTDMPSPVYYASVHKTSLMYKHTQNQFNVQVYNKLVYCTSVHITSLLVNNKRNVHGQNNTKECTETKHYQG